MFNKYIEYENYMGQSENTIKTYVKNVELFLSTTDKVVNEIRRADVNMFLMEYRKDHAYNSFHLMYSALKSFFDVVSDDLGLIESNPMEGVKCPKMAQNESESHHMPITKEQLDRMLMFAKNERDKAIILTYVSTGIRFVELSNLTLAQYKTRVDGRITLEITKGGEKRDIYLNKDVCKAIDSYIENMRKDGDYLFVSNQGTKMDGQSLTRTFKTICRRANMDDLAETISNHCFRSTFATMNVEKGVPMEVVAKAMGHKNTTTCSVLFNHYYQASGSSLKSAFGC